MTEMRRLEAELDAYGEALCLALPVMRRTAVEYLESVTVRLDPASIAPIEWEEIAPDLDAICAAETCVGRQSDSEWLDAILDSKRWRSASDKKGRDHG